MRTNVKSFLLAALAACMGAWAGTVTRVADGGKLELTSALNTAPSTSKTGISYLFFEKDGMLTVSGSGAICEIKPLLMATNGTLTVDVSGFTFTGETKPVRLTGGIFCETTGSLVLQGADELHVGSASSSLCTVMNVKNVALNGASLAMDGYFSAWNLPDRQAVPWTLAANTPFWIMRPDAMEGLYTDDNEMVFEGYGSRVITIALCASRSVRSGITMKIPNKMVVQVYPSAPYTKETIDGYEYLNYYTRGGSSGTVQDCDFDLTGTDSVLALALRNYTVNGNIKGLGRLQCDLSRGYNPRTEVTINGEVEVPRVDISAQADVGQALIFNNVCFTNAPLVTYNANATNVIFRFVKKDGVDYTPTFSRVSLPNEVDAYPNPILFDVGEGLTLKLQDVMAGAAFVQGKGTVQVGALRNAAKLFVLDNTATVEQDPTTEGSIFVRRDETRKDNRNYMTYYGSASDAAVSSLADYSGSLTALDGTTILADSAESTASVTALGALTVKNGAENWTNSLCLHFDASQLHTVSNLYVVEGSTKQNTATMAPVGFTTNTEYKAYYVSEWMDVLGRSPYLRNNRHDGGEVWPGVYPVCVTEGGPNGLPYLSFGKNKSGNRLVFTPSGRNVKFICLVFGSQNGGGAALFANNNRYSYEREYAAQDGKEKWENPIFKNEGVADVWLDGESVDPTKTGFNGGWQVISLEIKDSRAQTPTAIGYCRGYTTGTTNDSGEQNYAEILMFEEVPTAKERIELERSLAKKWGIAYQGPAVSEVSVSGEGPVAVSGQVTVKGDYAGDLVLTNDADVTLAGTVAPQTVRGEGALTALSQANVPTGFAADFVGQLTLGFAELAFDVNAGTGEAANGLDVRPAALAFAQPLAVRVNNTASICREGEIPLIRAARFVNASQAVIAGCSGPQMEKDKLSLREEADALVLRLPSGGMVLILR